MQYKDFKRMLREYSPKITCNQCKEMYEAMNTSTINIPCGIPCTQDPPVSKAGWWGREENTIASCKNAEPSDYIEYLANQNQEGINPMRYQDAVPQVATSILAVSPSVSIEATQRDFLTQRVKQTVDKLDKDLRKQFFMDADDRPETAEELIKAIEEGNYTLEQDKIDAVGDDIIHYNNEYGIRWGKDKADKKGYRTAKAVLKDVGQEAIDTVTTYPMDEANQALKDLKEWKYQA